MKSNNETGRIEWLKLENSILMDKIQKLKLKKEEMEENITLMKLEVVKHVIHAQKALIFFLIASWILFSLFLFMLS